MCAYLCYVYIYTNIKKGDIILGDSKDTQILNLGLDMGGGVLVHKSKTKNELGYIIKWF